MKNHVKYLIVSTLWGCPAIIGWCLSQNIPSFFANPYRATIFIVIAAITYTQYIAKTKFNFNMERKGSYEKTHPDLVLLGALCIFLAIAAVSGYSDGAGYLTLPEIFRPIGMGLCVVGLILVLIAIITLGNLASIYVTIFDKHTLKQKGIYRIIRHPWYAGQILFYLATPLVFVSIIGIFASLTIIPVFLWRIYKEEKMLKAEFGSRWDSYTKKTKKLIPFIY